MSYISIRNFALLSKLPESEVIEMMMRGKNFLDGSILTFVSQISGFEQEIMHNKESLESFVSSMKSSDFEVKVSDGIITIESKLWAPSMFFANKNWYDILLKLDSNLDAFSLLVPHRANGKLYLSDEKSIIRLSDSFEGIYDILTVEDLKTINL